MESNDARIAVVGGGLAGLTAGALLARQGAKVTVFEGADELGGMAQTQVRNGFSWNWGGHALYRGGATTAVLRSLGIEPDGAIIRGAPFMQVLRDGELLPGPFSPRTALSPVLNMTDRLELAKVYAAIGAARRERLATVSIAEWLDDHVRRPAVRELLLALVRLSSFANDPQQQSADAALQQLWLSLSGVWYLHGGWGQLVQALRGVAQDAGARIEPARGVTAVEHDDAVRAVQLHDGSRVAVDAAIVAVGGPRAAARVLDGPGAHIVAEWADAATPIRAATWELSLGRQPAGGVWLLGVDVPIYVNVHSHFARVAPGEGAVVHVVRYLGSDHPDDSHRTEMETTLDLMIPGWRDTVLDERFLPALTVAHDLPSAAHGGIAGRPGPLVPGVEGLAVVGDWVGTKGVLSDAAVASAATAATQLTGATGRVGAPV